MTQTLRAADVFAVGKGEQSLRRERPVADTPLPRKQPKPATSTGPTGLPVPRKRMLTARDIFAIAQHAQPWQALTVEQPLSEAG
ncbi:MAG: hypothetical protein AAF596_11275 [Planctomycetota bacterium]